MSSKSGLRTSRGASRGGRGRGGGGRGRGRGGSRGGGGAGGSAAGADGDSGPVKQRIISPFETIQHRSKHPVMNKKVRGSTESRLEARTAAIKKRQDTLRVELGQDNSANSVIDRRFGISTYHSTPITTAHSTLHTPHQPLAPDSVVGCAID